MDPDGDLSEQQEAELFRHYGIDYTSATAATDARTGRP